MGHSSHTTTTISRSLLRTDTHVEGYGTPPTAELRNLVKEIVQGGRAEHTLSNSECNLLCKGMRETGSEQAIDKWQGKAGRAKKKDSLKWLVSFTLVRRSRTDKQTSAKYAAKTLSRLFDLNANHSSTYSNAGQQGTDPLLQDVKLANPTQAETSKGPLSGEDDPLYEELEELYNLPYEGGRQPSLSGRRTTSPSQSDNNLSARPKKGGDHDYHSDNGMMPKNATTDRSPLLRRRSADSPARTGARPQISKSFQDLLEKDKKENLVTRDEDLISRRSTTSREHDQNVLDPNADRKDSTSAKTRRPSQSGKSPSAPPKTGSGRHSLSGRESTSGHTRDLSTLSRRGSAVSSASSTPSKTASHFTGHEQPNTPNTCLLYTSDAADE